MREIVVGGAQMGPIQQADSREELEVTAIHDERGYQTIRRLIADQYNLASQHPNIQVQRVDRRGDRSLTLRHTRYQRRPLSDTTDEMLRHVARLWGFTVRLEEVDHAGELIDTKECPVVQEVA